MSLETKLNPNHLTPEDRRELGILVGRSFAPNFYDSYRMLARINLYPDFRAYIERRVPDCAALIPRLRTPYETRKTLAGRLYMVLWSACNDLFLPHADLVPRQAALLAGYCLYVENASRELERIDGLPVDLPEPRNPLSEGLITKLLNEDREQSIPPPLEELVIPQTD